MKKKLFLLILVSFLSVPAAFAQDDDFPPTDDPDVPAAPINSYVPLFFLLGIAYAVGVHVKKKNEARKVS